MDIRHLQRTKIVQNLFAYSFGRHMTAPPIKKLPFSLPFPEEQKTQKIIKKLKTIDKLIKKYASRYPLANISRTDLSILRVSIYDLMLEKKTPPKVVINEAVEMAKEMSGENSFAFVNAILGKILTESEPTHPEGV
ncbi:transcription antitermination factor NusB [Candidatus Roizmanbacteria bacterium RIFCSPHIGHO2_01_FULL_35_10]|uniref:Transcription antitermination factor NusB n=1 Tax=Candidatus Roizmanbacteria bacterium RIFCSPLOWO2_01_FULL_35_13 TaxID=1802055 RepID=A0A1F7I8I0_9BACT|nr:MAG: transcription antitermination factor NusB [Candidatus Roizmanbacteria bacterium RIFCSPHIGHO2_01_FULL_35_10]OGK39663.1 MAG: transcription antitermination factor NusB [Candidatus Roizmanbacteria bacterium RIFCSPLOWO2_01_FULL_35_13]